MSGADVDPARPDPGGFPPPVTARVTSRAVYACRQATIARLLGDGRVARAFAPGAVRC